MCCGKYLLCALFCYLYTITQANVGKVVNIATSSVLYQESTTRNISWSPPVVSNGEDTSNFTYMVEYCELNFLRTCVNTTSYSNTYKVLTGLLRNTHYQYKIFALDAQNVTGEFAEKEPFQTEPRDTCRPGYFTCGNPQCVRNVTKCNGIRDCGDGLDETAVAGCPTPKRIPTWRTADTVKDMKSITVTWNKVTDQSDLTRRYTVENINTTYTTDVLHPQNSPAITKLSATFSSLLSNHEYHFRVRSVNQAGDGAWSDILKVKTIKAANVGKVGDITTSAVLYHESTARNLSWSPPVDNNGEDTSKFTYMVEHCKLNFLKLCVNSTITSDTYFIVTGLMRSNPYQYKIYVYDAQNTTGDSAEGDPFTTLDRDTCRPGYFACGNPQCVPDNRKCNGIIDCGDGSEESARANCSVPKSTPTWRTADAIAGSKSITVTWNKVTDATDLIQSYIVENNETSMTKDIKHPRLQPSITKLSTTFSGLSSNREYHFRVRSVNRAGSGPWSSILTINTSKAANIGKVGDIITSEVLYHESTARNLSWSPPVDNNGEDTSKFTYKVEHCKLNFLKTCVNSTITSDTYFIVTGLMRSHLYQYKIYVYDAQNTTGESAEGDPFTTLDRDTCRPGYFACGNPQCVPDNRKCNGIIDCGDGSEESARAGCPVPKSTPTWRTADAIAGSKSITVTWNKVTNAADLIQSYIVENNETSMTKAIKHPRLQPSITKLSTTFSGLLSNREYHFRVRSVNRAGSGPWSNILTKNTSKAAVGKIGPATNVNYYPPLHKESSSVNITWDPPTDLQNNSVGALTYQIVYCPLILTCTETTAVTHNEFMVIEGLTALTQYAFQIYVFNENHERMVDNTAPRLLRTRFRDRCYANQFSCVGANQCIAPGRTCNGIHDCADSSDEHVGAQCAPPPAVTGFLAKVIGGRSVTLQFNIFVDLKHRVTEYVIQNFDTNEKIRVPQGGLVASKKPRTVTFNGLMPNTNYKFKAWAVNPSGDSFTKTELLVKTLGAPTGNVTNLVVSNKQHSESSAVLLEWEAPTELATNLASELKYYVTYCRINMATTCKNTTFTSELKMDVSGLLKDDLYQFAVHVFNKYDIEGRISEIVIRTKKANTCIASKFKCIANNQCISRLNLCNGLPDCGDKSDEKKEAGCKAPQSKPRNFRVKSVTRTSIAVEFKQVPSSDRPTLFEVELKSDVANMGHTEGLIPTLGDALPREVNFTGLMPGVTYKVRARAINLAGNGEWTEILQVVTLIDAKVTMTTNSLSFEIILPLSGSNQDYEIEINSTNPFSTRKLVRTFNANTDKMTVLINKLDDGKMYEFRYRIKNGNIYGPWSSSIHARTDKDESSGLSNGEIAGIVIAAILMLIVIISVIVFCTKSRGGSTTKEVYKMENGFDNSAYEMGKK